MEKILYWSKWRQELLICTPSNLSLSLFLSVSLSLCLSERMILFKILYSSVSFVILISILSNSCMIYYHHDSIILLFFEFPQTTRRNGFVAASSFWSLHSKEREKILEERTDDEGSRNVQWIDKIMSFDDWALKKGREKQNVERMRKKEENEGVWIDRNESILSFYSSWCSILREQKWVFFLSLREEHDYVVRLI